MYKLYNPETHRYTAPLDMNNLTLIKRSLDYIKKHYPELCPMWCIDMETGEIVHEI